MIQQSMFADREPPACSGIQVVESDVGAFIASKPDECFDLVMADPPWVYDNATVRSSAAKEYDLLLMDGIVDHLRDVYRVARPDTYLGLWCTWPILAELMARYVLQPGGPAARRRNRYALGFGGWMYLSGGAWTKWYANGRPAEPGVGHHWRGDSEPLLLLKKGKPRSRYMVRNASVTVTESDAIVLAFEHNGHVSPRTQRHSEKPVEWIVQLLEAFSAPNAEVLELYGGTCPTARAARQTGRRCMSIEFDPERARLGRALLAQHR